MPNPGVNEPVHTISDVINRVNKVLDEEFLPLWVTGEVSNLYSRYHWYFTLIDGDASLSCAVWNSITKRIRIKVENGTKVNVRGKLAIYRERGQFQVLVDRMELAGEGALKAEFERLKRDLEREGLFRDEHKKPLPVFPRKVALITGESGAARTDVIRNFSRRYPLAELIEIPSLVQGRNAPESIVRALQKAMQAQIGADVVLLTRGGGSAEDLNAFNDENVARAIFACPMPVVSAIGHERDFTISDFVADKRASTPSTAVEIMTPDVEELSDIVSGTRRQIHFRVNTDLNARRQHLVTLNARLRQPSQAIERRSDALRLLAQKMRSSLSSQLQERNSHLTRLIDRVERASPTQQIAALERQLTNLSHRLQRANPVAHLSDLERRRADAKRRINELANAQMAQIANDLTVVAARLRQANPMASINRRIEQSNQVIAAMKGTMRESIGHLDNALQQRATTLRAVSPLATLERGYAVVTKPDGTTWGEIISSVDAVKAGETINAHVHGGTIAATVEATSERADEGNQDHAA